MPSLIDQPFWAVLSAVEQTARTGPAPIFHGLMWTFYAIGTLLMIRWLFSLRQGDPLACRPIRRHRLPHWFVIVQLFVWMLGSFLIVSVIKSLIPPSQDVLLETALHAGTGLWYLLLTALLLTTAHFGFARGLKGLGLDFRRLNKDILQAAGILWALLPLMVLSLEGTNWLGRFFRPDFEMDRHSSLLALLEYPQIWLRGLIILNAVLVVPIFEELLFRGLLQSTLTAALGRPWLSIVVVSALFAGMHPYPTHLAALLILSIGLGYAYEKSGSLLQPLFIHILFNGLNVAGALAGG